MPLTPGGYSEAFVLPASSGIQPTPEFHYVNQPSTPTREAVKCKVVAYHLPIHREERQSPFPSGLSRSPRGPAPEHAVATSAIVINEEETKGRHSVRKTLRGLFHGHHEMLPTERPGGMTPTRAGQSPASGDSPARTLSTMFHRALKSVKRRSQSLGGLQLPLPQLDVFGNDPFGRVAGGVADVLPGHRVPVSAHSGSPPWKTHARRTLSKGGKGSISSPLATSWGSQVSAAPGRIDWRTSATVTQRGPRSHQRSQHPRSEIPAGWTMTIALSKQVSPSRPLSKPVLFSEDSGVDVFGSQERVSMERISLDRRAALARLEGVE